MSLVAIFIPVVAVVLAIASTYDLLFMLKTQFISKVIEFFLLLMHSSFSLLFHFILTTPLALLPIFLLRSSILHSFIPHLIFIGSNSNFTF